MKTNEDNMAKLNWSVDKRKLFTPKEKEKLRRVTKLRRDVALRWNKKIPIREWLIVDLAFSTGLRVSEIADLKCGEICLDSRPYLIVKNGKGGKERIVWFGAKLKSHLLEYLTWKQNNNESIEESAPLLMSSNTKQHLSTRSIQKHFERCLKKAKIENHSIHHTRHTYASELLVASNNNLRLVQKQLGHSSISVTEVYLHIFNRIRDQAIRRFENFSY